jgi:aldose 1-epimerase
LAPTHVGADAALALHGHGWRTEWSVTERSPDRLVCRHAHGGGAKGAFPFSYVAEQSFAIEGNRLVISIAVTNVDGRAMPAGLGLHPYFRRTAQTRVAFKALGFFTPPTNIGRGALGPLPSLFGAGIAAPLPDDTLDHSFAGFGGVATIETGGLRIGLQSAAPVLHVFAPAGADYFCLEPVSHLPGELTGAETGYGGARLAPGERLALSMAIGRG